MTGLITQDDSGMAAIESTLIGGDLSKLSTEQRVRYYNETCQSLGLNPLTKPFDYIQLNGKLTLYARKDATEQLRSLRGVSLTIASREVTEGVFVVTARATDKGGRTDESVGAVSIKGLTGDALANAFMKAETKAKRRVTLSICGLGMLDETEIETIPDAKIRVAEVAPGIVKATKQESDCTVEVVAEPAIAKAILGADIPFPASSEEGELTDCGTVESLDAKWKEIKARLGKESRGAELTALMEAYKARRLAIKKGGN